MITIKVRFSDVFSVNNLDAQIKSFANNNAAADWIYRNREIIRRINDEPLGDFSYTKSELTFLITDPERFAELRWQKYESAGE